MTSPILRRTSLCLALFLAGCASNHHALAPLTQPQTRPSATRPAFINVHALIIVATQTSTSPPKKPWPIAPRSSPAAKPARKELAYALKDAGMAHHHQRHASHPGNCRHPRVRETHHPRNAFRPRAHAGEPYPHLSRRQEKKPPRCSTISCKPVSRTMSSCSSTTTRSFPGSSIC